MRRRLTPINTLTLGLLATLPRAIALRVGLPGWL